MPIAKREMGVSEANGEAVREAVARFAGALATTEVAIDVEVGFNLSPRRFWQPDLAERIVGQIATSGVDASRVMVEVTESSAMMDPDRAQAILELHRAGLAIAIDDFGTGYSSLSRLRDMPVKVLKIDRSFVRDVHADPAAASIVAAFLELARGLGISTLAEGSRPRRSWPLLRERGCAYGQGFLFSRPVPPEEIIAYAFGGIPGPTALRSA
jgi:EAL domain-containing protein (putative c-di-GMP-specific phosphodiesterase class I)